MNALPVTAPSQTQIDLHAAESFLDFMAEGEPVTFQTFSETPAAKARKTEKGDPLARILHGTLDEHAAELQRLHDAGAGVWFMVNRGDGRGRSVPNVTGVRALFADTDGVPLGLILAAGAEPHAIIETSPGKWHVYWIVTGCPLDRFAPAQRALAARFGTDAGVHDLPRVLRVPGFWHRKAEPFMVRAERLEPRQPYAFDDLARRLGLDFPTPQPEAAPADDEAPREFADARTVTELRSALNALDPDDRETWVAVGHRLKGLGRVGRELWVSWSQQSEKWQPADARQWDTFKPERTGFAAVFAAAQAAGWVNPASKAAALPASDATSGSERRAALVQPFDQFVAERRPVVWAVQRIVQRGYVYSLTARWGHGKTAVALPLAMHVAMGRLFAGHKVQQMRVLYMAGENPDDVRLRALKAADVFGMDHDVLAANLLFTSRSLNLTAEAQAAELLEKVAAAGIGLVVVDTGVAHSDMEEENSNVEMHALAVALRRLSEGLAGAAVVCLMHPPKIATRDTLNTRGGGAFAAEIDGELLLWQDEETQHAELFHSTKLRGPGFEPLFFELQRHEFDNIRDNFGDAVSTVVAVPVVVGDDVEANGAPLKRRKPTQEHALRTLLDAAVEHLAHDEAGQPRGVHVEDWRKFYYSASTADTPEAKKKAFQRTRISLQNDGLVDVVDDYYLPRDPGDYGTMILRAKQRDSGTGP